MLIYICTYILAEYSPAEYIYIYTYIFAKYLCVVDLSLCIYILESSAAHASHGLDTFYR